MSIGRDLPFDILEVLKNAEFALDYITETGRQSSTYHTATDIVIRRVRELGDMYQDLTFQTILDPRNRIIRVEVFQNE